jgi:hypothetical protein
LPDKRDVTFVRLICAFSDARFVLILRLISFLGLVTAEARLFSGRENSPSPVLGTPAAWMRPLPHFFGTGVGRGVRKTFGPAGFVPIGEGTCLVSSRSRNAG